MNAKDMFFELNLKFVSIGYKEEKVIEIMYHNDNGERVIMRKEYIDYEYNYFRNPLDTKYLPAIIQQFKELGWYE